MREKGRRGRGDDFSADPGNLDVFIILLSGLLGFFSPYYFAQFSTPHFFWGGIEN